MIAASSMKAMIFMGLPHSDRAADPPRRSSGSGDQLRRAAFPEGPSDFWSRQLPDQPPHPTVELVEPRRLGEHENALPVYLVDTAFPA